MLANRSTILPVLLRRRDCRKGFTLTEIAIVLGIMSVILAGIWTAASTVNEKSRLTQALNQYSTITQNMTALFQGGYGMNAANPPCAGPFPCDLTATLIGSQAIPAWIANGLNARHPWNATGFHVKWVSSAPRTYRMSFNQVDTKIGCLGLILQTTACTPGQAGCPTNITVAAGTAGAAGTANLLGTPPLIPPVVMNSTVADGLCTQNPYPGTLLNNSVEFDFTQ